MIVIVIYNYDAILRNKSKLSFNHNHPKPWNNYVRITLFFHISNLRYLVLPRTHNPLEIQLVVITIDLKFPFSQY